MSAENSNWSATEGEYNDDGWDSYVHPHNENDNTNTWGEEQGVGEEQQYKDGDAQGQGHWQSQQDGEQVGTSAFQTYYDASTNERILACLQQKQQQQTWSNKNQNSSSKQITKQGIGSFMLWIFLVPVLIAVHHKVITWLHFQEVFQWGAREKELRKGSMLKNADGTLNWKRFFELNYMWMLDINVRFLSLLVGQNYIFLNLYGERLRKYLIYGWGPWLFIANLRNLIFLYAYLTYSDFWQKMWVNMATIKYDDWHKGYFDFKSLEESGVGWWVDWLFWNAIPYVYAIMKQNAVFFPMHFGIFYTARRQAQSKKRNRDENYDQSQSNHNQRDAHTINIMPFPLQLSLYMMLSQLVIQEFEQAKLVFLRMVIRKYQQLRVKLIGDSGVPSVVVDVGFNFGLTGVIMPLCCSLLAYIFVGQRQIGQRSLAHQRKGTNSKISTDIINKEAVLGQSSNDTWISKFRDPRALYKWPLLTWLNLYCSMLRFSMSKCLQLSSSYWVLGLVIFKDYAYQWWHFSLRNSFQFVVYSLRWNAKTRGVDGLQNFLQRIGTYQTNSQLQQNEKSPESSGLGAELNATGLWKSLDVDYSKTKSTSQEQEQQFDYGANLWQIKSRRLPFLGGMNILQANSLAVDMVPTGLRCVYTTSQRYPDILACAAFLLANFNFDQNNEDTSNVEKLILQAEWQLKPWRQYQKSIQEMGEDFASFEWWSSASRKSQTKNSKEHTLYEQLVQKSAAQCKPICIESGKFSNKGGNAGDGKRILNFSPEHRTTEIDWNVVALSVGMVITWVYEVPPIYGADKAGEANCRLLYGASGSGASNSWSRGIYHWLANTKFWQGQLNLYESTMRLSLLGEYSDDSYAGRLVNQVLQVVDTREFLVDFISVDESEQKQHQQQDHGDQQTAQLPSSKDEETNSDITKDEELNNNNISAVHQYPLGWFPKRQIQQLLPIIAVLQFATLHQGLCRAIAKLAMSLSLLIFYLATTKYEKAQSDSSHGGYIYPWSQFQYMHDYEMYRLVRHDLWVTECDIGFAVYWKSQGMQGKFADCAVIQKNQYPVFWTILWVCFLVDLVELVSIIGFAVGRAEYKQQYNNNSLQQEQQSNNYNAKPDQNASNNQQKSISLYCPQFTNSMLRSLTRSWLHIFAFTGTIAVSMPFIITLFLHCSEPFGNVMEATQHISIVFQLLRDTPINYIDSIDLDVCTGVRPQSFMFQDGLKIYDRFYNDWI